VNLERERRPQPGENIVARGSEAREGNAIVPAGTVIGAAEIALAATCGLAALDVYARPKVAIVATGDELVEIDATPDERQIRNSNSYALAALVASAGGEAKRMEIARDLREELRERIAQARRADLMLLSGGVSMGKFDLVEEVLAEFGAQFFFIGVKMQPGKPLVFGRLPEQARTPEREMVPECYFFGLPGNPISTQVTFHCFVEPFLRVLAGENVTGPKFAQATLAEDVEGKPGLMRMLPAYLRSELRQPSVKLVGWHGSGDLLCGTPAGEDGVSPGRGDLRAAAVA
jgi:molybdopterin molybdotransferase